MTTKVTVVERYTEAWSELQKAVNALDQAHAMLRDINLHTAIAAKVQGHYVSLEDVVKIADSMLLQLQNITCDDCGQPMGDVEACLSGHCPEVAGGN